MKSASLFSPDQAINWDSELVLDAHVESRRLHAGRVDHRLSLVCGSGTSTQWTKEIDLNVDAPFDVPDLVNLDAFVLAALFPAMEAGGTLRVHGPVSRSLIRNILDYQGIWAQVAPGVCKPFALQVAEVDDRPEVRPESQSQALLAFSGGMDSMLALYRNFSGDAGPTGYNVGAAMTVVGFGSEYGSGEDTVAFANEMRRVCGRCSIPTAIVETNISGVVGKRQLAHGTWLAACQTLFSGCFGIGLLGSTIAFSRPGYEIYGSHPLIDRLLSSGRMAIRNDEGLYNRVEKAAVLARYPAALEDLRVCTQPYRGESNCCRCEKCIRTMLCFIASSSPIPLAFKKGLRLQDIGIGMGQTDGLLLARMILDFAEVHGTVDEPAIRVLQRRYRTKRLKVAAKTWLKQLSERRSRHRWFVLDYLTPDAQRR